MSIYEHILHIDEATFDKLMSTGFLRANAKRDLRIYEYYLVECEKHGSMQAITNSAEKFCLSTDHIKRVIYHVRNISRQNQLKYTD